MKRMITRSCALVALLFAFAITASQADNLKDTEITDHFPWASCAASPGLVHSCTLGIDCNPYFPLVIGHVIELDNSDCDDCEEFERVTVTILPDLELVNGVWTRVMEEREWVGEFGEEPELAEVSRNFVAMCPHTQDVFYFGEDVCLDPEDEDAAAEFTDWDHYDCSIDELAYGPEGAWRAGLFDAEPGLLFPGGTFLLNAAYFQELADNALDWALNAEAGIEEAGFEDCVLVLDRNLLEDPKSKEAGDEKVYCPDFGIVRDEELVLVD